MTRQKQELLYLDPNNIIVDPNKNIRNDDNYGDEDFEELKESIKKQGVKQPIYVYKNMRDIYEVAHGFRRGLAIKILLEEGNDVLAVPAIETTENDIEILLDHLILNYGRPLTQLEQSGILKGLSDKGLSNKDIAEKTGIQYQKVVYLVKFKNEAFDELINEIKKDNISFTVALELLRVAGQVIKNQNNILSKCRQKAKLNGNEKITMKDISDVKYELEENNLDSGEKEGTVEKEPDASKNDGEITVETETEEEIDDMPEQKVSNDQQENDEDEGGFEVYLWDFTQYIKENKSQISGSNNFFDLNRFISTLEYIQKNVDEKSYEKLFNDIFNNK